MMMVVIGVAVVMADTSTLAAAAGSSRTHENARRGDNDTSAQRALERRRR